MSHLDGAKADLDEAEIFLDAPGSYPPGPQRRVMVCLLSCLRHIVTHLLRNEVEPR